MLNTRNVVMRGASMVVRVLTVFVAGLLVAGCLLQTKPLRSTENGVWLGVKNTSYDKVWQAANKVMARRFKVTKPDAEMGTIVGQDYAYEISFIEKVEFFVWPTENSDTGYSIDVDSFQGRLWFRDDNKDWKKIIIEDLKKELGQS
jgi:hypothetical protein